MWRMFSQSRLLVNLTVDDHLNWLTVTAFYQILDSDFLGFLALYRTPSPKLGRIQHLFTQI